MQLIDPLRYYLIDAPQLKAIGLVIEVVLRASKLVSSFQLVFGGLLRKRCPIQQFNASIQTRESTNHDKGRAESG